MIELPGPLVTADWLQAHAGSVVLADVRWSIPTGPKRQDYEAGHIPGAVFVDLDADLSEEPGPRGRHPLPSPEDFATARARLGLVEPVVAYDDTGGATASRLWWMLDSIGVPAAVLEGGTEAWSGEWESGIVHPTPAAVSTIPWPDARYIDADALLGAIDAGAVALDARSAERFRGEENPIDARYGHVPGARSWPWETSLRADGTFLPAAVLRERFEAAGVQEPDDLVTSCGSGVTGCHVLLAARVAGIEGGRLYAGSWSEWGGDPNRPIETGET